MSVLEEKLCDFNAVLGDHQLLFSPAKDCVVSLIGMYPGLNCKQLTSLVSQVKKERISHQAVYKILDSLVLGKVVSKIERKYFLDDNWVSECKNFFEKIIERKNNFQAGIIMF